jgi:molybdenum cofactor biosynthesis enzyme MoaA
MFKSYCAYIDHQLMIDFQGRLGPCCQFEDSSDIENYNQMIKNCITEYDSGNLPKACRQCWVDEERGIESLRQGANEYFNRVDTNKGIVSLDIRINNHCNLACTMCSPHASTLWGKLKNKDSFLSLTDQQMQYVKEISNNLEIVSIQGGEPFYGNAFIDFVDQLPNKNQISLEIFTNVISADINKIVQWSQEFKHVLIHASADGVGNLYTQIRWPTTWQKFEDKIQRIKNINNVSITLFYAVQSINATGILDFINWRNSDLPNASIQFSLVNHPNCLSLYSLTDAEKSTTLADLEDLKFSASSQEKERIQSIVELIRTIEYNPNLVVERNEYLTHINTLRSKHTSK